jgi:acetyl esterase/lipase
MVAGDSSGGGLSLALTLVLRDLDLPLPAHLILFAPWIDLTASTPGFEDCVDRDPLLAQAGIDLAAEIYAGALARSNPVVSPLYGDPTDICPTTLVLGTNDALYAEDCLWADKAEQSGVDLGTFTAFGGFHVFPAATWTPESKAAMSYIKRRVSVLV